MRRPLNRYNALPRDTSSRLASLAATLAVVTVFGFNALRPPALLSGGPIGAEQKWGLMRPVKKATFYGDVLGAASLSSARVSMPKPFNNKQNTQEKSPGRTKLMGLGRPF